MLRTLGALALEGSSLSRPKLLVLLAYLALEGPKSRRVLTEIIYAGAQDPRDALSSAIRHIQQHARGVLNVTSEVLSCTLMCDAISFLKALDQGDPFEALALYRGPFLKDVSLGDAGELEEWVLEKREHFALLARGAQLSLAEQALAIKDMDVARRYAEAAFQLEGTPVLEEDEAVRLQRLLARTKSSWLKRLHEEARALHLTLPELHRKVVHLPPALTSFVGREQELLSLARLLSDHAVRLVSVHGPAGVGKTRLALQSAFDQQVKGGFPDGIFFVNLEPVADPSALPVAVLETMDLSLEGSASASMQLQVQLGTRRVLLVLDNFEPLIEARGPLQELMSACPNLTLLVTSRERLNLEAEWVLTLAGLPLPSQQLELEEARGVQALQLYVDRARQARLDFELTEDNLPHARSICQLVDGYPLGLELAATWAGVQPLASTVKALERDVMGLSTPLENVRNRHRSVRAAFEHSWHLLDDGSRSTLRSLATFGGGFDLLAAAAVARTDLNGLKRLVDKSLLKVDREGRFDFHPLLRQFAGEKLDEDADEVAACLERHGVYYLSFLAPIYEDIMGGPGTRAALAAVEREMPNLRLAWTWAVTEKRSDLLVDPIASIGLYCETRSRFHLGVELFTELIDGLDESNPDHHVALGAAYGLKGFLLIRAQSGEAALEMAAKGQALLRPHMRPTRNWALWMALEASVGAHWARGELDEGERHVRENLALARSDAANARDDIDLRVAEVFAGISLHVLGMFDIIRGRYARAIPYLEESRDLLAKHTSITLSYTLWNLGQAELYSGEPARARATLERGLELSQALGYSTMVGYILTDLARAHLALNEPGMTLSISQDVIGMTQRNGDRRLEATARVLSGHAQTTTNAKEALGSLLNALQLASPIGALEVVTEALAGVSVIWDGQGLKTEASALAKTVLAHEATSAATRQLLSSIDADDSNNPEPGRHPQIQPQVSDLDATVERVSRISAQILT